MLAQEMFGAYLTSIMERGHLIDPSPLSGQLCELTPRMRLVVEELWNEFTVKVDPQDGLTCPHSRDPPSDSLVDVHLAPFCEVAWNVLQNGD